MSLKEPGTLDHLLDAVDTAVWTWSIKKHRKPSSGIRVDWKNALEQLCESYRKYEAEQTIMVIPE